nr:hypothetical protein [Tanacetum cinerariifolium]
MIRLSPRLISKGVFSQKKTPSLGNALTLSNRFKDTFGDTTNAVTLNEVEADLSNMKTSIPEEPKKIFDALKDPSWVESMQEELLQFKIHNVWVLVDCPKGVRPIGTKWVHKNKKDERGNVIRNKARLVAQREFEALMHDKFQMSAMGELTFFLGLRVLQKKDGIFLSQDKYVGDILKKFGYSDVRTVPLFASMIVTQGEGLANPTEPHHIPAPQEHQSPQSDYSPQHDSPPLSHQTIIFEPIPHDLQAPTKTLTPRRLTKRAIRIAQSKAISPDADEPTSPLRDDKHKEAFPTVSSLDAGKDRENIAKTSTMSHESSPRVPSLDVDEGNIGEELGADKSTKKGSNDTEEMVNVLSSMDAANILSSGGVAFSTASVSPADVFQLLVFPLLVEVFPLLVQFLHCQCGNTIYKKVKRLIEQVARDSEIARIHAEEELKLMIEGLDRSNKVITKHLSEYEQAKADLSIGEKIELITSKKKQRKFYMSVLKSHAGWKTKHFKGMTLEQIKEKFILVWKQWEDFVPMSSKEESERVKRPGIKLDQGSSKRVKISHTSRSEPSQEKQFKGSKGVSEEVLKRMMQLVPLEEVYIEALQIIRLGGHIGAYQFFVDMLNQFDRDDLHQLCAPNPSKVKTGLRPRAAHEVPLLTATASRVIDMEDPDVATESSGTPSTIEKSSLDFDNENPSPPMTEGKGTKDQAYETVTPEIPPKEICLPQELLLWDPV